MIIMRKIQIFYLVVILVCSCTKKENSNDFYTIENKINQFVKNHNLNDSILIDYYNDTINIKFTKSERDSLIFERYDLFKFNLLYSDLYKFLDSSQVVLMEQRYLYSNGTFYKSFTKKLDSNMVYKYYLENSIFKSASEYILDSMNVSDILSFQSLIDVSNNHYEDFNCVGTIIDLTALYSLEQIGVVQGNFAEVRLRTMGVIIKSAEPEGNLSNYLDYIFRLTKDDIVDPNFVPPLTVRE